jgi:hypothetical protein
VLSKTLDSNEDPPRKLSANAGGRREGDWIAGRLRRVYDEVRAEPLPDQFLVLLGKISGREEADDQSVDGTPPDGKRSRTR